VPQNRSAPMFLCSSGAFRSNVKIWRCPGFRG